VTRYEIGSSTGRAAMLSKVPRVTAVFWIIKVLGATGMSVFFPAVILVLVVPLDP